MVTLYPQSFSARVYKTGSDFVCQTSDGKLLASSTEPATVLQAGIDYATGKGALFIKDATYTCNALGNGALSGQILTIPSNTEIIGESRDRTKIVLGASVTDKNLLQNSDTASGNTNIILKNLTCDASLSVAKATINLDRTTKVLIQNMYLKNGASSSFNLFLTGGRDGSQVPNFWVDNSLVDNNVFESHNSCDEDNYGGGLLRNSVVSNNIFFNSGGSAGFAQRLASNSVISNNVSFNNNTAGYNLEACSDCIISNNIAHDNGGAGFVSLYITTGQPDGFAQRNLFVGNQAWLNRRGFEIDGQKHRFIGNVARNNEVSGIDLTDADRCIVAFNECANNGTDTGVAETFRAGIRLAYEAQTGYTFVGKTYLYGNMCYDDQGVPTQRYGILETGATVGNNFIFDNYLENNVDANLSLSSSTTKHGRNIGNNSEMYDNPNRALLTLVGSSTAYANAGLVRYAGIGTLNTNVHATEANVQITYPFAFRIKRLLVKFSASTTSGGNTVIGLRDDGATVASVSVGAGSTTEADSGAIDVAVAAGSKINWIIDASAVTGGHTLASCVASIVVTSF